MCVAPFSIDPYFVFILWPCTANLRRATKSHGILILVCVKKRHQNNEYNRDCEVIALFTSCLLLFEDRHVGLFRVWLAISNGAHAVSLGQAGLCTVAVFGIHCGKKNSRLSHVIMCLSLVDH